MKTIISTFGEEPEGVIQGIKQFGCEEMILLVPERLRSEKAKRGLKRIEHLTNNMGIRLEKVEVSPYSLMENIKKIKELISKSDNSIILNITGGRKILSIAAVLAGFVSKTEKIIYIQEETNVPIEIPRFTLYENILSKEKRSILNSIKINTTVGEIQKSLKKDNISKNYPVIMKHLRELENMGLIRTENSRPHKYTLLPSGNFLG